MTERIPTVELHRHLDVSFRMSTLLEWAQERGLEGASTSLESFSQKLAITEPMSDLGTALEKFNYVQKLYDRYDVMERLAFEAAEDCAREGLDSIEFRYSPGFVSKLSKLPWQEALDGICAGLARAHTVYPALKTRLIAIISRDLGMDSADRTLELVLKNPECFCALDLAGDEDAFPLLPYRSIFKRAKQEGVGITIHAGESKGPDHVWEAVELLGADRIGHGIGAAQDQSLMSYLRENQIGLEVCPTSNWLTGCVASFETHPLGTLLRAGVPVCLNTDDPGIFFVRGGAAQPSLSGVVAAERGPGSGFSGYGRLTLAHEISTAMTRMGIGPREIDLMKRHALAMSFADKPMGSA